MTCIEFFVFVILSASICLLHQFSRTEEGNATIMLPIPRPPVESWNALTTWCVKSNSIQASDKTSSYLSPIYDTPFVVYFNCTIEIEISGSKGR